MGLFTKKQESIEDPLLNLTLDEIFTMLHKQMDEKEMPVRMGVMYQNVLFTITCEPSTPENIMDIIKHNEIKEEE